MADRVLGQLTLADSLVRGEETIFDRIGREVDWNALDRLLGARSGPGRGEASYPATLLLRCLLLGMWHGLSDPALEAQVRDRLSFRRFAGLSLTDETPDHCTFWRFREELRKDGRIDAVFEEINRQLDAKGLIVRKGTLVDATFLKARSRPPVRPRNGGEGPSRPAADRDARWGSKGKTSTFGYKMHIGVDQKHTIIRKVEVTDASVADTEQADALISRDEKSVYGDQAYSTHKRHEWLTAARIKDRLARRPNRHHPVLPPKELRRNQLIARIRAAVERPFAVFKERYGLGRLRFFNVGTNRTHCLIAACAYNLRAMIRAVNLQKAT